MSKNVTEEIVQREESKPSFGKYMKAKRKIDEHYNKLGNQELINNWEPKSNGLKLANIVIRCVSAFFNKDDLYITMNDPEVSFIVQSYTSAQNERLNIKLQKYMKLAIDRFSVGTCGVNSKVLVTLQLRRVSK